MSGPTTIENTQFLWCGPSQCEDRDLLASAVTRRFNSGFKVSGNNQFTVADHLGSLTEVTQQNASVISRYVYDPFGRADTTTGDPAVASFTGHALEPQLGVYQTRTRAYDAGLGRWLSRDPLGLDASPNEYGYVSGNPIALFDPLGLVQVRWALNTRFSDPDMACRTATGGACSRGVTAVVLGYCTETPCGGFQLKTILSVSADIFVSPGKFPYKGRKPRDRKVHDAESAFYHEFAVHLFPAVAAGAQVLSMFEQNLYASEGACLSALGTARILAISEFRRALDRSRIFDQ